MSENLADMFKESGLGGLDDAAKPWDEDDDVWNEKPSVSEDGVKKESITEEEARANSIEAKKIIKRLMGKVGQQKKGKPKQKPKSSSTGRKGKVTKKGKGKTRK